MAAKVVKFGRYTLLGLMTRGGMGEIYHAQLIGVAGFEKRCIIKKIRRELASDHAFIERFLNEGRTLVALTHSNIVQIFDMGEVDGEYYLAMEYVDGPDLRVLLRRIRPKHIPVNIAIAIAIEVLRGLGYAHRAKGSDGTPLGIVHGDISPSNILISTEGEVKLIDFGIARGIKTQYRESVVQGKFAYMSPEQARGETLDNRTDIFSMGVVLYEMLAGIRPFEGNSDIITAADAKFDSYHAISNFDVGIDSDLESIVSRSLDINRENRYATADEFMDVLIAYARDHEMLAGQREIYAFFKPYFVDEPILNASSADEFLSSALDRMLCAQAFAETRTSTIVPESVTASESPECAPPEDGHIDGEARAAGDMPPQTENPVSDGSRDSENSVTDASLPDESIDVPVRAASDKPIRRFLIKMRYIIIGIVVTVLTLSAVMIYRYASSPVKADMLRRALHDIRMADTPENGPAFQNPENEISDAEAFALAAAEPFDLSNIIEHISGYRRGLPFAIYTVPDMATVYIIEGEYRALEDKHFIIIPGNDVEIAVQAPKFETCLLRMKFSEDGSFEDFDSNNCGTLSPIFSARTGKVEVLVNLRTIRSKIDDIDSKMEAAEKNLPEPETLREKKDSVPDIPTETDRDEASGAAKKSPQKTRSKERERTESRRPAAAGTRSRENRHAPDSAADKPEHKALHAVRGNANRRASLSTGRETCETPCELTGTEGMAFAVYPKVSGRVIGIPYRGVLAPDAVADVDFCELKIRILESYVADDPAPYQAADIYIDGKRIAKQTEFVTVVLPCGSHEIKAEIQAESSRLLGIESVDLAVGRTHVQSMRLQAR